MFEATPIVFVVDDDALASQSVQRLLRSTGFRLEIFEAAREFLARPRSRTPSCVLLDVVLPDLDGLELQRRVAAERRDMPVIFITACVDVATSVRAMKAGALEFLSKPVDEAALVCTVRHAMECSRTILACEGELQALRERHGSLSRREREVMDLIVAGQLNKQAGGELGITEATVKAHRGSVMRKMEAGSLAQLVGMAVKLGPAIASTPGTVLNSRHARFSPVLAHA